MVSNQSWLSHEPVIPPRLSRERHHVPDEILDRLAGAETTDVVDCVGPLYTISPAIRPLYTPPPRVVGRALTVKAWPGDNLAIHGALGMVQDGDVLVIDWRGYIDGCGSGAQSLAHPAACGLKGVIIDGAWRDVEELRELGLGVYARCVSPVSPPKQRPGEVGVPVSCGGVVVEPGDVIVADEEGIAVVPSYFAEIIADTVGALPPHSPKSLDECRARAQKRADLYDEEFRRAGGLVIAPRMET